MSKSKVQCYGELQTLLEKDDIEQILKLLADFMSANEMERFLDHVKEEKGYGN